MKKIYLGHSLSFDYKYELYKPIRESSLNNIYEIVFPHEKGSEQFDSKKCLRECDLMIAEVTSPATGLWIEIGWANLFNVPVICVYKRGSIPAGSLQGITNVFIEYGSVLELIDKLDDKLTNMLK